jgi:preprotein translocase subunit SecB
MMNAQLSPLVLKSETLNRLQLVSVPADKTASQVSKALRCKPQIYKRKDKPREFRTVLEVVCQHQRPNSEGVKIEIEVEGVFEVSADWPEDEIRKLVHANSPGLLYGVARELILSLTSRCKGGAVLLPSVTFAPWKKANEQPQEGKTSAKPEASR